jgi:hypothetical protein
MSFASDSARKKPTLEALGLFRIDALCQFHDHGFCVVRPRLLNSAASLSAIRCSALERVSEENNPVLPASHTTASAAQTTNAAMAKAARMSMAKGLKPSKLACDPFPPRTCVVGLRKNAGQSVSIPASAINTAMMRSQFTWRAMNVRSAFMYLAALLKARKAGEALVL